MNYMRIIKPFISALYNLYYQYRPKKNRPDYGFAFMIHPRNLFDVRRKFPLFKILPDRWTFFFTSHFWPITVSKITGLKSKNEEIIPGWVISIPLTAQQMLNNRDLALKHIIKACQLAKNKGAKIIGLGALTSSLSKGGLDLINIVDIAVTTGHSYTAFNVTETLLKILKDLNKQFEESTLAIVGASGSIGRASTEILSKYNFQEIILIDLERKRDKLEELSKIIKNYNIHTKLTVSNTVTDIERADFIITATNTPEALVRSNNVKPGAIIIDDAQPSDVAEDVYHREDVLVLSAGAVHTPGITTNFNLGLNGRYDNFCCLAEVLILASEKRNSHYTINRTNEILIKELEEKGRELGFKVAQYQNPRGLVSDKKIEKMRSLKFAN